MTLPNFFIVGAARSGTPSLYNYLGQHPQVYMSPVKEPNFYFLEGIADQIRGKASRAWLKTCVTTRKEYLALFRGVADEKAIGEASVFYLSRETAAQAIQRDVPEARIFATLRHPVDRAYSAYLGTRLAGTERAASFRAALDRDVERPPSTLYSGRYRYDGLYFEHLSRFYSLFDRERIHIHLFDDFTTDPMNVVRKIFGQLEVDASFEPDTSTRHNPTGVIRNPLAHWMWTRSRPIRYEPSSEGTIDPTSRGSRT
ncbi:MAG: sulfotransferase [Acidobacteriota bacterium]